MDVPTPARPRGLAGGALLVVSLAALGANLALLALLVAVGLSKVPAQALAIVLVTPLSFLGNKLWSFRYAGRFRGPRQRPCRLGKPESRLSPGLARAVVLALLVRGRAAATPTAPVYDSKGHLIGTPVPEPPKPTLTSDRATELALADPKIADWIARYPADGLSDEASFSADDNAWTVKVWSTEPDAGQIVLAKVDDSTGRVTEAWTGPQVAWTMASGDKGSFGRKINDARIWWPLSAVFFLGLANLRRPLSLRNLDLLVLLSFSASWWFFNEGEIFTSVPLAYPPLVYLLLRMAWSGSGRGRAGAVRPVWPVWLLAGADDLYRRLQDRPQRRGVERHRRRLRGGHRRAANRRRRRDALRQHAGTRGRGVRRPTRTATSAIGSRRTVAASRPTTAATPTGRSTTSRTSPATSPTAGAASGTISRPPTSARSCSTASR